VVYGTLTEIKNLQQKLDFLPSLILYQIKPVPVLLHVLCFKFRVALLGLIPYNEFTVFMITTRYRYITKLSSFTSILQNEIWTKRIQDGARKVLPESLKYG
jgi:hypothetical protein